MLYFFTYFDMFDIIDQSLFADCVHEHFSVLDRQYVEDQSDGLYGALQATFDQAYETRFIILDLETCKPVNTNAVVKTYESAEVVVKVLGAEKYTIGFLLIER